MILRSVHVLLLFTYYVITMSEVQELLKNVQQQSEHILSLCSSILTGHRISKPVAVVKPINNDFLRINADINQHKPLLCNDFKEIDADCTQHEPIVHLDNPDSDNFERINADFTQHMPLLCQAEALLHVDNPHFNDNFVRSNAENTQHMPLLCQAEALSEIVADDDQHMPKLHVDIPDFNNNSVGINADNIQHKPLLHNLHKDNTLLEVDADNGQHGPNLCVDDSDFVVINADIDQHMPLLNDKLVFDTENQRDNHDFVNSSVLSIGEAEKLLVPQESDISQIPKKSYCTYCCKSSHIKKYCWKFKRESKKKKSPFESNDIVDIYPLDSNFVGISDSHPLVTNNQLLTKINVEGVMHLRAEIDTAASFNMISKSDFDSLQRELTKRGLPRSKRLEKVVNISLADGSLVDQLCPVVELEVSDNLDSLSKSPHSLEFFVVKDCPNNLIGRTGLASLWPTEFDRFRQATCENFVREFNYNDPKHKIIIEANKIQNSIKGAKQKSKPKTKSLSKKGNGCMVGNSRLVSSGQPAKFSRVAGGAQVSVPPLSSPSPAPVVVDRVAPVLPSSRILLPLPDSEISQEIGLVHIKKTGVLPPAKMFGLEDEFDKHLQILYNCS